MSPLETPQGSNQLNYKALGSNISITIFGITQETQKRVNTNDHKSLAIEQHQVSVLVSII